MAQFSHIQNALSLWYYYWLTSDLADRQKSTNIFCWVRYVYSRTLKTILGNKVSYFSLFLVVCIYLILPRFVKILSMK